jgi:site-specific DNA recombinase
MKAALYARVSTDEQRKESIDDQLRECRELCRRHGFDVIGEFYDRARSGNENNRSGYRRLLTAARHHALDVIVAHELSRLWRSESEMHTIKEELEYLNVHVITDDGIDTRIAGMDVLIAIKGAMAKQELRQIAHRTHRALTVKGWPWMDGAPVENAMGISRRLEVARAGAKSTRLRPAKFGRYSHGMPLARVPGG